MPPVIPAGLLIDQGPTFGGINDTTIDKPVFFSVDGNYPLRPTDTATTAGSARQVVANINSVAGASWRFPTEAELRPVFNGNRPGETTHQHLNRVFGTSGKFAGQSFVWTTNTRGQLVTYDGGGGGKHVNVTTLTGMLIDGQSIVRNDQRPHFPLDPQSTHQATVNMINQMWDATGGGIIVLGTAGPVSYL